MSFSIAATTRRLLAPRHELSCTWLRWRRLVAGLKARGGGERESGAFLLGTIADDGRRHISHFIFYDELDPSCLDTGLVRFDGRHYGELWRRCSELKLLVVADVHTHPGGEHQSDTDRANPMVAQADHLALIVPHYARDPAKQVVGIYRYLGNRSWRAIPEQQRVSFLFLGPW